MDFSEKLRLHEPRTDCARIAIYGTQLIAPNHPALNIAIECLDEPSPENLQAAKEAYAKVTEERRIAIYRANVVAANRSKSIEQVQIAAGLCCVENALWSVVEPASAALATRMIYECINGQKRAIMLKYAQQILGDTSS